MARLHFNVLSGRGEGFHEVVAPIPKAVPAGYTPMIAAVEWLTLNCRGDWACRARGRSVCLRFALASDRARALAHFAGAS